MGKKIASSIHFFDMESLYNEFKGSKIDKRKEVDGISSRSRSQGGYGEIGRRYGLN